jgi:hypothetical protein
MFAIRLLEESGKGSDVSWFVWAVLIFFILMVVLGWWASKRLPKDDVSVEPHGHDENIVAPVSEADAATIPDDLT